MEGFQLHGAFINPLSAFCGIGRRVELRVEGQHVQVHFLIAHRLHGLVHILDKHTVGRSCAMNAHHHLRLPQRLLLLLLAAGSALLHRLLVAVDGIVAQLVVADEGRGQQFVQLGSKRLSYRRIADDVDTVVQPSHHFRVVVVIVPRACHIRAQEGRTGKDGTGIGRHPHPMTDLTHQGEVVEHLLYPFAPSQQLLIQRMRILFLGHHPVQGPGFQQSLLQSDGLVFAIVLLAGSLHGGLHRVVLGNQVLYPRLCLEGLQNPVRRVIQTVAQIHSQIAHPIVPLTNPGHFPVQPGIDDLRNGNPVIG